MEWIKRIFRSDRSNLQSILVGLWETEMEQGELKKISINKYTVFFGDDNTLSFVRFYEDGTYVSTCSEYVIDDTKITTQLPAGAPKTSIKIEVISKSEIILHEGSLSFKFKKIKNKGLLAPSAKSILDYQVSKISSYSDINFIVNGKRITKSILMGPQSGIDFFDKLKDFLKGECTVNFNIGNQLVENQVKLNGNNFQVNTSFKSKDIESFLDNERLRVREEMLKANYDEDPTDIYFLPASIILAEDNTLPEFNLNKLVKDPRGPRFFVSHRWLSPNHPDPNGKHLAILKEHAKSQPDAFYWIDFSCLPQSRNSDDQDLFNKTLPKITSIQAKASTIIISETDYNERLWCYIEHYAGLLFSKTNLSTIGKIPRRIEYLGTGNNNKEILDKVISLEEPIWNDFKVTKQSDIPGIKYNYTWLSNLVKFQLYDRFSELRNSLPGSIVYSGAHYPHCAFGIDYSKTIDNIFSLFEEFGIAKENLYKDNTLLEFSEEFSWSADPDDYEINDFKFSETLFSSQEMVGWIALLLGIIKILNSRNIEKVNCRDLYSKIVLMSFYK